MPKPGPWSAPIPASCKLKNACFKLYESCLLFFPPENIGRRGGTGYQFCSMICLCLPIDMYTKEPSCSRALDRSLEQMYGCRNNDFRLEMAQILKMRIYIHVEGWECVKFLRSDKETCWFFSSLNRRDVNKLALLFQPNARQPPR